MHYALLGLLVLFCASAHGAASVTELKRLSFEELMDVEVTSVARQDSTIGRSPAAIHVITADDIRRSGVTTIPELLRRVPGVNVARVDANKWAISARGFNDRFANKLLVQIDGRTVYSPIFSGVLWDTIDYPLADIERIEVIRGPGASVWGANAVNGVINIITKSARDTKGGLASGGGGTEELAFGTVRYGGTVRDRVDYRVYARGFDRDTSSGVAPAPFDGWSGASSGFRIDAHSGDADRVTLQGDYFRSDAERIDFRPQPSPPYLYTNAEHEISDGANLLARWTKNLHDSSRWTLQAYWDHIKRRSTGDILVFSMDILDVDFQHQLAFGQRHNIVWGLGYRVMDADLTDSRFDGFILRWDRHDRRLATPSVFVQDQITIGSALNVTLGTKLEHNELTGFEVQPTIRFLWTPSEEHTAWASVSRAVRTPTLFEDQRSVTQTPVSPTPGVTFFPRIVANPDLASEEMLAYEVGYRVQAAESLSVDAAVFYNDYDELKVFAPQGATAIGAPSGTSLRILTHQNRMRADTRGVELGIKWAPVHWWQLYGAYSVLRMSLHADGELPLMNRAASEAIGRQSPEQQAFVQSSWDLSGNAQFDLIGRFVDRLSGFQQPVDDYVAMDLRFAWRLNQRLTLEIVAQNVLDENHLELGGSVLAGPLHEIERSVYAQATVAW